MKRDSTHPKTTADDLAGIELRWSGDFLFLGKIGVGFVGYDLRSAPEHFIAYVGRDDNQVGRFASRDAARAEIVRYIREGQHVPF